MIEVVFKDGSYWSLNNRRLFVFKQLESKRLCKVIRVKVKQDSDAITEWLQRNTTRDAGQSLSIRLTKEEAEMYPTEALEIFETLQEAKEMEDNRKPHGWSREKWEQERRDKEAREHALRNPVASVPSGWGAQGCSLPTVAIDEVGMAPDEMFDQADLEFDLDDFDGATDDELLSSDSGRLSGSLSNLSDETDLSWGQGEVFDETDFDYDGCLVTEPAPVEVAESDEAAYYSHVLSTDINSKDSTTSKFNSHKSVEVQPLFDELEKLRHLESQMYPQVVNKGKKKRPLSYFYLKSYGNKRPPVLDQPEDAANGKVFYCGCGHTEDIMSELVRHKDKSGHWANHCGSGFDSLRYMIETEDLKICPG